MAYKKRLQEINIVFGYLNSQIIIAEDVIGKYTEFTRKKTFDCQDQVKKEKGYTSSILDEAVAKILWKDVSMREAWNNRDKAYKDLRKIKEKKLSLSKEYCTIYKEFLESES